MLQPHSGYIKTTSLQVLKQQESGEPPPPLELLKVLPKCSDWQKQSSEYSFTRFQGEGTQTKPVYLRSSCCFANGTLTV